MYERYERIVKSLRSCMRLEESAFECIEMDGGCCDSIGRCIPHLMDEAADAIEELQKKYDGAVSENKSLCRQIAELAKERNEAYSKWMLLINTEPPKEEKNKWTN